MKNAFFEKVYGLQNIKRFSNRTVVVVHSPAEHCYYVALLAQFIAEHENMKRDPKDHFDLGVLFAKALGHDIPESITGDILFPIKHSSEAIHQKIVELEEVAVKDELLKYLPKQLQAKYFDNIINCKEGREGELVALCDQLEVLYYLAEERKLGNKSEWVVEVFYVVADFCAKLLIPVNSSTARRLYEQAIESFEKFLNKSEFKKASD